MIKQDYYATDKQGNCVNYGFNCFSCSHWYGYFDNGGCDMVKTISTTTNLRRCGMNGKRYELKQYDNGLFIQDNENNKVQYYSQSKASMSKVVDILNELSEKLYEQCRPRPITLTTRISDEDWEKFKELFKIYCDYGDVDD